MTTRATPATISVDRAVLVVAGRGDLPFATLHDRPLWVHALDALAALEDLDLTVVVDLAHELDVAEALTRRGRGGPAVRVLSATRWWAEVRARPTGGVLVHDPLCPLTASDFLDAVRVVAQEEPEASVAAYRPVTDTVKTVVADQISGTVDREGLAAVVAPVVVSGRALAAPGRRPPPLDDLGQLVGWLRERGPVTLHRAPSSARRVDDASAVNLLECVDELNRQVRHDGAGR